jgi:outer membrane protein assembly factor BamE
MLLGSFYMELTPRVPAMQIERITPMKPKFLIITIIYSTSLFLANCALYQIDVQQGNVVTQDMLDQLELYMPAKKVRFIMGAPLLIDPFHPKRWDYLYSFQYGKGKRDQRHIALIFDNEDRLLKVEGDVKAGLREKPKPLSPPTHEETEQPVL